MRTGALSNNVNTVTTHIRDREIGVTATAHVPKKPTNHLNPYKLSRQHVRDALAGAAVAVGVGRAGHARVLVRIGGQAAELAVDDVLVGADELEGAGLHALRALDGVAHDEH